MKKIKILLGALILIASLSANAGAFEIQNFTLDFSVLDNNFIAKTGINNINYDSVHEPNTWIYQDLGADNVLGNGDTFTENGFMNLSTVSPGGAPFLYDLDGSLGGSAFQQYYVNMYYAGIKGSIYNYDNNSTADTADDTWDFSFDSGVGTVGWYLDDDADPTNGFKSTLLTGHIIQLSSGTADGFLSSVGASSNWDVTAEIDSVNISGFLLDEDGNELWDTLGQFNWLQTITTGDTTITEQYYLAGTDQEYGGGDDQYLFVGSTGDQTVLNAVPEPSTFILLGFGLAGLGFFSRRRKS